jgi:hypothetical protein
MLFIIKNLVIYLEINIMHDVKLPVRQKYFLSKSILDGYLKCKKRKKKNALIFLLKVQP